MKIFSAEETDMPVFAKKLIRCLHSPLVVFLKGNLGSGKTSLVRECLKQWGYHGKVKSPTYTIVETYDCVAFQVAHFDLYRLNDPEELEMIGVKDYFTKDTIVFVEWPEKGLNYLPSPDLTLQLTLSPNGRDIVADIHTSTIKLSVFQ